MYTPCPLSGGDLIRTLLLGLSSHKNNLVSQVDTSHGLHWLEVSAYCPGINSDYTGQASLLCFVPENLELTNLRVTNHN